MLSPNIVLIEKFIENDKALFDFLMQTIIWNDKFTVRKTASFGIAYQYSGVSYEEQPFSPTITVLAEKIAQQLEFLPNNCLINYYENGQSKMGFHVDNISQMVVGTGVAIISLGATRDITYRLIADKNIKLSYPLTSGSLLYMDDNVQKLWQHAILKDSTTMPRMSLTFRQLV